MKSTFLVAAMLLLSPSARAEYVCYATMMPASFSSVSGSGNGGYVSAVYYTGKDCTGTFVNTIFYCSAGATLSTCATASNCGGESYLYNADELRQLAGMLQQAQLHNQRVDPYVCTAGSQAGKYVRFAAN